MSIKMPTLASCKNFKMSGIKNLRFNFTQLMAAILMSNFFVYLLCSTEVKPEAAILPEADNILIRVPLKLIIPFSKGFHFTIVDQAQKIVIAEAIFSQEIKKDENDESGLYLIEVPKNLLGKIPKLLKQDLTAIPQMAIVNTKQPIKQKEEHENIEISF